MEETCMHVFRLCVCVCVCVFLKFVCMYNTYTPIDVSSKNKTGTK